MTHEMTVHRADVTLAAGLPYEVAPDVAADAIDEWLEIVQWAQRTLPEDTARELRGPHLEHPSRTPPTPARR
ncbi:maleylpyruvate isomerase family mycothiol-dependent enzyme [Streptomyces hirsutus]